MWETAVETAQYIVFVLNYLGSISIIVAFYRCRSKKMGKYKYFFLVGAALDLIMTFGNTLLQMRAVFRQHTALFTATGWFCCTPITLPVAGIVLASVVGSLLLVVYNFIYRFAIQTRIKLFHPFLNPRYFALLSVVPGILVPQFSAVIAYCYGPDYELAIVQRYLAEQGQTSVGVPAYIIYTNASSFLCQQALLTESTLAIFGCIGIIVFCFCFITFELYYWKTSLSAVTRRMHTKMLILLCCQILSCCIFLFLPVAIAAASLATGNTFNDSFGHFLLVLVNMGATSNTVLIISFIPEYRVQLFGVKRKAKVVAFSTVFLIK